MSTPPHTPALVTAAATFIGIDYHKRYSVWHALDAAGQSLGKGRIERKRHTQRRLKSLATLRP